MATADDEVDDILRQMTRIRVNLHHEMRNVVAGAEAAVEWRSYVVRHPLTCLAVAFSAGYLLVPRKRRSVRATAEAAATQAAERVRESVAEEFNQREVHRERRSGVLKAAAVAIAPVAWRFAQAYAAQYLETLLARTPAGGNGRPNEPAASPGNPPRRG